MVSDVGWRSPKGKLLTHSDQIPISISRSDITALHAAIEEGISRVDQIVDRMSLRSSRFALVERLIRIRKAILDATWDHDDVPRSERSYE